MRKYLKTIETAGILMMFMGVVISFIWDKQLAVWECGIGIALFLLVFIIKAFNWKEYAEENKRNLFIVLITIVILLISMLRL